MPPQASNWVFIAQFGQIYTDFKICYKNLIFEFQNVLEAANLTSIRDVVGWIKYEVVRISLFGANKNGVPAGLRYDRVLRMYDRVCDTCTVDISAHITVYWIIIQMVRWLYDRDFSIVDQYIQLHSDRTFVVPIARTSYSRTWHTAILTCRIIDIFWTWYSGWYLSCDNKKRRKYQRIVTGPYT